MPFQRQPGGDVVFVVHVGYDNLLSAAERLPDRQTHQTNERSRVHAKRDFARITCVHKISDTLPRTENRRVYFTAFHVASPALHVALDEVMIHRVQYDLWNLRTGCVVEKDEAGRPGQRREGRANGFNGETCIRSGRDCGVENARGFGLQAFAPGYT